MNPVTQNDYVKFDNWVQLVASAARAILAASDDRCHPDLLPLAEVLLKFDVSPAGLLEGAEIAELYFNVCALVTTIATVQIPARLEMLIAQIDEMQEDVW